MCVFEKSVRLEEKAQALVISMQMQLELQDVHFVILEACNIVIFSSILMGCARGRADWTDFSNAPNTLGLNKWSTWATEMLTLRQHQAELQGQR
jgi:hypothetical protein